MLRCVGSVFVYLLPTLGLTIWGICASLPQTETTSGEEAVEAIVHEGLLAGLSQQGIELAAQRQVTETVEEAVEEAAVRDPELTDEVVEDVTTSATGPATEAATQIVEEVLPDVEQAAAEIAESASAEDIDDIAEVIVDSALSHLSLEPGTLDQGMRVFAAATLAVNETFNSDRTQQQLQPLGLTSQEELDLQAAVADSLASAIVRASTEATSATIEELSSAGLDVETVEEVVDSGILAALSEGQLQLAAESSVEDAVEDSVDIAADDAISDDATAVKEQVTDAAAEPAKDATIDIISEMTAAIESRAKSLAEDATEEDARRTAEVIVELTIANLRVDAGTLRDEEAVSEAVSSATGQTFADERVSQELSALGLEQAQASMLKQTAAEEVTSHLVSGSTQATQLTISLLTQIVLESLEKESSVLFGGPFEILSALFGTLGFSGLVAPVANAAFRRISPGALKLEPGTGGPGNLRYAVAAHCTVEGVQLESFQFLGLNAVRKDITELSKTGSAVPLPFVLDPGHDDLTATFGPRSSLTFAWNLRLLLRCLRRCGDDKFYYAFRVNGHWSTYPISY